MRTTNFSLSLVFAAILMMSFTNTINKWDFLGKRAVNYTVDRDEIKVTIKEGSFRKIKFEVERAPVHFRKIVVHYRNGSKENIEIRDQIRAGGQTKTIDLNGKNRIINK